MLKQVGPFTVPSKEMKKNIDEEYKQSILKAKATKDELNILKELLKVFPRGPKIKEAYEDYIAGKIDIKGNIINSSKKKIIETTIKEMPEEKKKRSSKEEAAEAREREAIAKEALKAELKQIVYEMYMKGSITSPYSTELRNLIDNGKMTKSNLIKKIHAHKISYGIMDPEERGRSPSPEPVAKRGRPKKVKSPERSKSPEPKAKKISKSELKTKVDNMEDKKQISSTMSKIMKKKINNEDIETTKELRNFNGDFGDIYPIKPHEETPSSIVKSSKTLKDALKQPVKQLDIMTATVKAKLDAHDKVMIDTYLKLRKDLTAKEKKAVRLSIQNEINDKMKGSGLSHPMHQIYGYGINRTEDALEYFQHVKNRFGKI